MAGPEAKVKARIKEILKAHKCWYCMPNAGGYGTSGVPDFIACHRGTFLGIEAKAKPNKATQLQQMQIDDILIAGGWGIVVNEDRLDDLDGLLNAITDTANDSRKQFDASYRHHLLKQMAGEKDVIQ